MLRKYSHLSVVTVTSSVSFPLSVSKSVSCSFFCSLVFTLSLVEFNAFISYPFCLYIPIKVCSNNTSTSWWRQFSASEKGGGGWIMWHAFYFQRACYTSSEFFMKASVTCSWSSGGFHHKEVDRLSSHFPSGTGWQGQSGAGGNLKKKKVHVGHPLWCMKS